MAHGRVRKVVEEEESICERASKPLCLHNPSEAAFRFRFNLREELASRHLLAGLPSCRACFCSLSDHSEWPGRSSSSLRDLLH